MESHPHSETITVCFRCKFFLNKEPNTPRADVWYNHLCQKRPLLKGINPVTGKPQYIASNDLGQYHYTDQEFVFCRDINNGNCQDFEEM